MSAYVLLVAAALSAAPVVDIKQGEPSPIDGAVVDYATAEGIRQKRAACEEQNRQLREILNQKDLELTATPSTFPPGYLIAFLAGALLGSLAAVAALK